MYRLLLRYVACGVHNYIRYREEHGIPSHKRYFIMFVRGHTVLFCVCVIWSIKERHKATTSSCVPQAKRVTWASCVCVIWSVKERHKATTPNGAPQREAGAMGFLYLCDSVSTGTTQGCYT